MPLVITEESAGDACNKMVLDDSVRETFKGEFWFQVVQANQKQPEVPHTENLIAFLAAGVYAVSSKFGVPMGDVVMTQFGKFLNALIPGEEKKKFRNKVSGYFAKTFNVKIEAA